MSGPLSFLRSVYDVGNLDTRFTTPSSVPHRTAVEARGDGAVKPGPRAKPARWNTPEFFVYYLVIGTAVPTMFWVAYDVSRRMSPGCCPSACFPHVCCSPSASHPSSCTAAEPLR